MLDIPSIDSCHIASMYLTLNGLCTDPSIKDAVYAGCKGTCDICAKLSTTTTTTTERPLPEGFMLYVYIRVLNKKGV